MTKKSRNLYLKTVNLFQCKIKKETTQFFQKKYIKQKPFNKIDWKYLKNEKHGWTNDTNFAILPYINENARDKYVIDKSIKK
jgi:hypothetical protein